MRIANVRVGKALSLGILLSILVVLFSPGAEKSALLRGDFPGFYVQAVIVASGRASDLYNLDLQKQIENEAWPELNSSFLISVYPPSLALLLSPLGYMSAKIAQLVFTLLSCACLFIGFNYLKSRGSFLKECPWLLFALLISNPFLLIGSIGGQNTAFSIAILSLGMLLIEAMKARESKSIGLLAGLVFSLWLFKPQFGIFLLPGLLCFRFWYPLIGFIFGGILHYLSGAILLGFLWPFEWIRKLMEFSSLNYASNGMNQASIIGSLNSIFQTSLRDSASTSSLASIIPIVLVVVLTFTVLLVTTRAGKKGENTGSIVAFWFYVGSIPLISPQTLFYDVGITFFAALACLKGILSLKAEHKILIFWGVLQIFSWLSLLFRELSAVPLFSIIALLYLYFSYSLKGNIITTKNTLVCESNCG